MYCMNHAMHAYTFKKIKKAEWLILLVPEYKTLSA